MNDTQIKMLVDIEQGRAKLPATRLEFYNSVKSILTAYDFEGYEKPLIEKCRDQFVRISLSSEDIGNWVYLSEVVNVIRKRKYYTDLSSSMANRGIKDPSIVIVKGMIEDGLLLVSGKKVAATLKAQDQFESKQDELQDFLRETMQEKK